MQWVARIGISLLLGSVSCWNTANSVEVESRDGVLYSCKQGGVERRILVRYLSAHDRLPCEVRYFKEGQDQAGAVLWSAQTELGYCEKKAQDFAVRLDGMGWQCSEHLPPSKPQSNPQKNS